MHATGDRGARRARGLVVGRFGTAPIVVRPGWLLATVLLAVVSAPVARAVLPGLSPAGAYVVGAGFGLLLLGSVLVHELAHAAMARRRGIAVRQIVLTLVGGHTEMAEAATPATSALVAVAGPLANAVLALAAWAGLRAVPPGTVAEAALGVLATSNAVVAAFNLLPGLPMDGGWILEAIVWRATGRRRAGTRGAAVVGRVVAVGLLAFAVAWPLATGRDPSVTAVVWAAVIGVTLWTSAGDFLALADWRGKVEGMDLTRLARPAVASAAVVLSDLPHDVGGRGPEVVLVADGRVVGYVDGAALAQVPLQHRSGTPVEAVLVPLPARATVDGALRGPDALRAVGEVARSTPVMVVLGPRGDVVGLLRYADVTAALRTRGARGARGARSAPDAS